MNPSRLFVTLTLLSALAACTTSSDIVRPPATNADTAFGQPYVDIEETRQHPVPHRYVHGGFTGTDTRFSFYFPDKGSYQGRFFQHVTPTPDHENLAQRKRTGEEDTLSFAMQSGAYYVETNGGGNGRTAVADNDPTVGAYRANAAAAEFSREVAKRVYGTQQRPYGYIYGGSGGGYRTIGAIENTSGVWDGAVPYVIGSTMSLPNVFTIRLHAMRLLWNKFPQINDALDAGGSGNPYAGLDAEQAAALKEATRMGFPPGAWFGYRTMGVHGFAAVYPGMLAADPGYFRDYWTLPGYLGANPPASLTRARIVREARVAGLISAQQGERLGLARQQSDGGVDNAFLAGQDSAPVAVRLDARIAAEHFLGGDLFVLDGAAAGSRIQISRIDGDLAVFGTVDKGVVEKIKAGDRVKLDNSDFLAAQTYHRHQVPGAGFPGWDQFRSADGTALYPQRAALIAPGFTQAAVGSLPTGKINGKVIVVAALWDREAFPWQADWYRRQVSAHLDGREDERFRLWYTQHALHGDTAAQEDPTRTVSYLGMLHQALRDVSAWAERGVAPPASTGYRVEDAQVVIPMQAHERKGIQPVVTLQADGATRAVVKAGQRVRLVASAETPPGGGAIVEARWDLDASGAFAVPGALRAQAGNKATIETEHVFERPGTYFPTVRVVAQRDARPGSPFARLQNLARVRVVVQ